MPHSLMREHTNMLQEEIYCEECGNPIFHGEDCYKRVYYDTDQGWMGTEYYCIDCYEEMEAQRCLPYPYTPQTESRKAWRQCLLLWWQAFGDCPIDDKECIELEFMHFSVGTSRYDVWRFFEDCGLDVVSLLYGGTDAV